MRFGYVLKEKINSSMEILMEFEDYYLVKEKYRDFRHYVRFMATCYYVINREGYVMIDEKYNKAHTTNMQLIYDLKEKFPEEFL